MLSPVNKQIDIFFCFFGFLVLETFFVTFTKFSETLYSRAGRCCKELADQRTDE